MIANSKESPELKESPAALLAQAHTAQAANDFKKAAYLFGVVLLQEPANKMALFGKACSHCNYGLLLQAQGKLVEAAEHYEAALKINPNLAVTHCNYGILLMDQGKLVEAVEHYEAALRINPNHALFHFNYGILLQVQGKLGEAAEHYKAALRINPKHANTHFNYAMLLRDDMNDAKAALSHSRAAVKLDDNCQRRTGYGCTLFALGDLALAEVELRKALEMKAGDTEAQKMLDRVQNTKS